jgi:NAD(P)-dependent dehydrogenase (short-subunit alcohol dehydrogenase family)
MPIALVTGASRGLGRALTHELHDRGWSLVVDARRADDLHHEWRDAPRVTAIAGDVSDGEHRAALASAVADHGSLDLLVNNASYLGPSPQPQLMDYPLGELQRVYDVDVFAPLALLQLLAPALHATGGVVINVSSDAAVEAYEGWGGYGSAKAALDQLSAVFAGEHRSLRVYAFDPGDMRTEMHQQAFPDEDISDRPEPETVVPAVLALLERRPPSGRYRAAEILEPVGTC